LESRPIYHKRDATIRGHVFCSFLALVLKKELDNRLNKADRGFEWADIKQNLKAVQETVVEDN
jgi:transposase